jgi:sugar phosphate isomerase/epimerase
MNLSIVLSLQHTQFSALAFQGKAEEHLQKIKSLGYDGVLESLKTCSREAEKQGVYLWIEPLNRYETNLINRIEEGIRLIEEVGSKNLGLLPDTFHMNIEERSIEDSLRKSIPYFRHVHIADSNRWAPGCGHLNFKSILETLREIGYQGFLSMEILPQPNPDEAAKLAMEFFRKVEST